MIKKTISKNFKDFSSNLAASLLIRLFNAPNKYNLESALQYYSECIIEKPFHMSDTSQEEVLGIMQNIHFLRATGIDKLSRKFLKDGAEILAKPIKESCTQNSHLFLKKEKKNLIHLTTDLFHCYQ